MWFLQRKAESASAVTWWVAGGGEQAARCWASMDPLRSVGPSMLEIRSQSLTGPGTQACGAAGAPVQPKLKLDCPGPNASTGAGAPVVSDGMATAAAEMSVRPRRAQR